MGKLGKEVALDEEGYILAISPWQALAKIYSDTAGKS
jgi:hypothetical protein